MSDVPKLAHNSVPEGEPLLFFVKLKGYGLADKNGKMLMEIGQSTKRIMAHDDAPLALVVAILNNWEKAWRYSSVEAGKADLERLKQYVNSIEIG